jgi:hypothetical protein
MLVSDARKTRVLRELKTLDLCLNCEQRYERKGPAQKYCGVRCQQRRWELLDKPSYARRWHHKKTACATCGALVYKQAGRTPRCAACYHAQRREAAGWAPTPPPLRRVA